MHIDKTYQEIDIQEDLLQLISPELLNTLLKDHTTSSQEVQHNIFWATDDYAYLGEGYQYKDEILPERITGEYGQIIRPRVLKHHDTQTNRVREMAEVFTPSWVCNQQNNLIDAEWLGRADLFNREIILPSGEHTWEVNPEPIRFPEGKTWQDYVRSTRIEITCGEAPYLVSRYDTTTGASIPLASRIGLLDRKMRVVSENTETSQEWLDAAKIAYQSIYAYEWQGDSLLLARESMLYSFIEYYRAKFEREPRPESIKHVAYIISWNLWQMDGLKGVVPDSCGAADDLEVDLFGCPIESKPCIGCTQGNIRGHSGTYCYIKDWSRKEPTTGRMGRRTRYIDLLM